MRKKRKKTYNRAACRGRTLAHVPGCQCTPDDKNALLAPLGTPFTRGRDFPRSIAESREIRVDHAGRLQSCALRAESYLVLGHLLQGRQLLCSSDVYSGNFGVYSGSGTHLWSSGTVLGIGNYILILQPNRKLVLYGSARWSTRTYIATAGFVPVAINGTTEE